MNTVKRERPIRGNFENVFRSYPPWQDADLLAARFVHLPRRAAQAMDPRYDFDDFLASRWGGVGKMQKNELLVWEVSQSVKIVLPRWVRIKKKSDSHAAWEC